MNKTKGDKEMTNKEMNKNNKGDKEMTNKEMQLEREKYHLNKNALSFTNKPSQLHCKTLLDTTKELFFIFNTLPLEYMTGLSAMEKDYIVKVKGFLSLTEWVFKTSQKRFSGKFDIDSMCAAQLSKSLGHMHGFITMLASRHKQNIGIHGFDRTAYEA